MLDQTLKTLNPQQLEAVKIVKGPALIEAGAGSGKTKVLTTRIAYLIKEHQVNPTQILGVTFTNKAAREMKERIKSLIAATTNKTPILGTFHSVSVRILREDISSLAGYSRNFVIYDTDDQCRLITQILKDLALSVKDNPARKLQAAISQLKNAKTSEDKLKNPILKRVYQAYQELLVENNALDFDDLLLKVVSLWKNNPEVLEKYQTRWPFVLVDEYQDTNSVQSEWVRLLAAANKNLFVVGDPAQSIYLWRGADVSNILNFTQEYPQAKVVKLAQNYRSTKAILAVSNKVIEASQLVASRDLWTNNQIGVTPKLVEVNDERAEGKFILDQIFPANTGQHSTQEWSYQSESTEEWSSGILGSIMNSNQNQPKKNYSFSRQDFNLKKRIETNLNQIDLNKYVIIYRTNAQSRILEDVLLSYNVPYRIVGGLKFYSRREIKDILAYLRLLINPHDLVSLARIINLPARGIGAKTWQKIIDFLRSRSDLTFLDLFLQPDLEVGLTGQRLTMMKQFVTFYHDLKQQSAEWSIDQFIDSIGKQSGYYQYLETNDKAEGTDRYQNVQELKSVAKNFSDKTGIDILEPFLAEVSLSSDNEEFQEQNQSAITLITTHSVKGLEFPHVFMVGMEEGLFPHSSSLLDPNELEEERRLCYVGMTRAQEVLYLTHARSRTLYGRTNYNQPSQFVSKIQNNLLAQVKY